MQKEIPLLNLGRLHGEIKNELDEAIQRVIGKSAFILGEEVDAFEKEYAGYFGRKFAIGVGNGTDAITLILLALGIGEGDEVITTSLSAFPTAEAILRAGAKPVYVDIDPETFNIDSQKITEAITAKTKAVLPVHLYGLAANLGEIIKIAEAYKLHLVEDCAQAHGATYNGKFVGTFGVAGAFSFFPSKNLGAMGDGGMVITDEEAIAKKIKSLRAHGEEGRFNHTYVGFNSRLDGLQAAILRVKLTHLARHNGDRKKVAQFFERELGNHPAIITPKSAPNYKSEHVYHLYVIRVRDPQKRDELRKHLEERGVKTNVHYPTPLHKQPAYSVSQSLPHVEKTVNQIISIPLFPLMNEEEMKQVAHAINEWKG